MNVQSGLNVTPIDVLINASRGTLIELPAFTEGVPFVARLKRPSMLALVKSGKIPNALITTANELFNGSKLDTDDKDSLSNLFGVLDALCEACFVEPSYQELKDAGVELTDDQLMFIFNYTQTGVNALGNFRSQLSHPTNPADEQAVLQDSQ